MKLKKKFLLAKWKLKSAVPEPVKFWREFLALPVKKRLLKNKGFEPGDWEKDGFLVLCCEHVSLFRSEEDADSGSVIGYHVCQKKGCGKKATHELFPGLKKQLEEFDPEDAISLEEFEEKVGG